MSNATSSSNPSFIVNVGEVYPYPSLITPNIVTVKLSGKNKYNMWKTQMLCLLKSHQMDGFIDGQFPRPAGNGKGKVKDMEAWTISDSLVKGWILGSLSEEAFNKVVNHLTHKQKSPDFTAKDLWDELQCSYGPRVREQAAETKITRRQAESVIGVSSIPEDAKSKDEPTEEKTKEEKFYEIMDKDLDKRWLYKSVLRGDTDFVIRQSERIGLRPWEKLTNNGNTVLHVAVGSSTKNHELLEKLLGMMTPEENTLLDLVNSDGSTILHVAAIGGNIKAVNMLVERNQELLLAKDDKGHTPLALSVSNMHTKTSHCLFEHMKEHMKEHRHLLEQKVKRCDALLSGEDIMTCKMLEQQKEYDALLSGEVIMTCKTLEQQKEYDALYTGKSAEDIKISKCLLEQQEKDDALFSGQSGEDLVVLAISCQDFRLAKMIINEYPDAILSDSDAVLTTLAQNFPRELNFWERRDHFMWEVEDRMEYYEHRLRRVAEYFNRSLWSLLLLIPLWFFFKGFSFIGTAFSQFPKAIVHPFIKDTSQVNKDALSLLYDIRNEILVRDNPNTNHHYYSNSIFEATRQNSSTFIRIIMMRFSDAIWSANEDGHNFIQYSVINRSEKIYNLLYEMSEHKNIYKTIKDSSENNLLHLAARLAPTNKLNLIRGAALRIQRELQWFKEVERFVCPLNRLQRNSDDETPEMVFTKEHKDLVIEGENWIKKAAESYTITAALIITIVFAAAITVPGGNDQESGKPIFNDNIAFTIFAIADAISLFTAVTSLLMFLSILTARFAEQDFLYKLPTKMIIGLTMLFLSTTAMIIAFGATLFLVFGQRNLLMLIPIGALTCLPITSFVTLQCPLIVELISATYGRGIFVRDFYNYYFY